MNKNSEAAEEVNCMIIFWNGIIISMFNNKRDGNAGELHQRLCYK